MSGRADIAIVGAGLAGSLLAVLLGKQGARVRVLKGRPDPRGAFAAAGRSINLAISARGLHALERAGLAAELLERAIPMKGRMIHPLAGELTFQPYGTHGEAINSVSRAGLNAMLLDAAERTPGVTLEFSQRCEDVDLERRTLRFANEDTLEADLIIGADGAFSRVRKALQRERFDYSQSYLSYGYKELYLPPHDDGTFRMDQNALHIWPRGGFMMIALPNQGGSFTATLFWAFTGKNSFAELATPDDVQRYFARTYPDALPLMPTLAHDFLHNPTSSLVTVRCGPWHWGERAVLVGDAAHAVVPFYGQGANAAFEDCVVLADCLASGAPREAALARYYEQRKTHTDTLADLALANFVEMRDHVASPWFLLGKKLEKLLHRVFPRWFVPLYQMVSFTRTPYADAVARARQQTRVLKVLVVTVFAAALAYGVLS